MKNAAIAPIIAVFIISLLPNKADAQTYPPLLNPSYEWYGVKVDNPMYCPPMGICYSFWDRVNKDSVVYGKKYKVLNREYSYGITGDFMGFIREDTTQKKVFYIPNPTRNGGDTSEILLYDFSMKIGDTLIYPGHIGDTVFVKGVDSIKFADGSYRRRLIIRFGHAGMVDDHHIEGMGSYSGILPTTTEGVSYIGLRCLSIDGQRLYPFLASSYCAEANSVVELANNKVRYANFFLSDFRNAYDKMRIKEITFMDMLGRNIHSSEILSTSFVNQNIIIYRLITENDEHISGIILAN